MARFEFKLPDIGEGIAEAEIVAWHVKVGDEVTEDQQLADMMTDKATVEMESPVAGGSPHWPARWARWCRSAPCWSCSKPTSMRKPKPKAVKPANLAHHAKMGSRSLTAMWSPIPT